MSPAASPSESVEAFARICAALDNPFGDRTNILRAWGLDEPAFVRLVDMWSVGLSATGAIATELAERFGYAYRTACSAKEAMAESVQASLSIAAVDSPRIGSAVGEPVPQGRLVQADTPSLMKEPTFSPMDTVAGTRIAAEAAPAQTWETLKLSATLNPGSPSAAGATVPFAEQTPRAAPAAMSTGTAPVDISKLVRAAMPFGPGNSGTAQSAARLPPEPKSLSTASGFGETEEVNLVALMKRLPPLPFEEPAPKPTAVTLPAVPEEGSLSPAPQRRLVRFDPQTGKPLGMARWEDVPTPEKKP
jgi:hypothetical protein